MKRIVAVAIALAAVSALARPARACGGFFCSQTPINQSGENIVFAMSGDHVQATVQIQYAGDAKQFAWVVPVHAKPTLSVGASSLFSFLAQRTQPQFFLDFSDSSCNSFFPVEDAGAPGAGATGGANGGGGVTVISSGAVGPYDTAVLQATDAAALQKWLADNHYDLTPAGNAALVPYIGPDYYFVALRLQQDKGVGDLRPITLDMDGAAPCIPIQLTAIAAQANMPITAYILADGRAVPTNYRHVIINESRIDWLSFGSNYTTVATAAIDEAGGHAFLTEFAGTVASALGGAKLDNGNLTTDNLATMTDPVDFVLALESENFPRDGLLDMLEKYVPEPQSLKDQGISDQQFYNQIGSFRDAIANDPNRAPFDAQAFAAELDATVVKPLANAQKMLDSQHYLTRLFTTMSPAEMTVDPEFSFNTGLSDVSNVHHAKATCGALESDDVTITLDDGRVFRVKRGDGPLTTGPNAERVEQLAAMGAPVVIKDNSKPVGDAMARSTGCACSGIEPVGLLGFAALLRLRRRRTA